MRLDQNFDLRASHELKFLSRLPRKQGDDRDPTIDFDSDRRRTVFNDPHDPRPTVARARMDSVGLTQDNDVLGTNAYEHIRRPLPQRVSQCDNGQRPDAHRDKPLLAA